MNRIIKLNMEKVNQYNFLKHNVLPISKSKSILEVAANHIGLHAARLPTPYVTLCSRMEEYSTRMLWDELYLQRNLIKLRCMRTTLHIVPLEIAPVVHNSTLSFRTAKCKLYYKKNNFDNDIIAYLKSIIIDLVKREPMSTAEIEKKIKCLNKNDDRLKNEFLTRTVIKDMWETGDLCYINNSKDWGKETRLYGYTSGYYKNLDLNSIDEESSIKKLVNYYIDRFGPVTLSDLSWWSGINMKLLKNAMIEIDTKFIKVRIDNYQDEFIMTEDDYEKYEKFNGYNEEWSALLAYEDPCLKGYYKTRYRYVEDNYINRAFNQIGEVRNSIIINGKIKGIWNWVKKKQKINIELFEKINDHNMTKVLDTVDRYEFCLSNNTKQLEFKYL